MVVELSRNKTFQVTLHSHQFHPKLVNSQSSMGAFHELHTDHEPESQSMYYCQLVWSTHSGSPERDSRLAIRELRNCQCFGLDYHYKMASTVFHHWQVQSSYHMYSHRSLQCSHSFAHTCGFLLDIHLHLLLHVIINRFVWYKYIIVLNIPSQVYPLPLKA